MRTISVEPLTRVEGHGRVELTLEGGRLTRVRVRLGESPRLFEALLVGRSFAEVPALICRICAICSAVHRIAAAGALEKALGVEIPEAAAKVRELLLLGGHIESHALHLFCLVLPDLEGTDSILELLKGGDAAARQGLDLKALGNRIQETAGGRTIHPINVEVGGVLRHPDRQQLEEILRRSEAWEEPLERFEGLFGEVQAYPASPRALGRRLSVSGGAGFSLQGEDLVISDGRTIAGERYAGLLSERAVAHSNAKRSEGAGAPFLCGSLARLENAHARGAAEGLPERFPAGIHGNNVAQVAELRWALERCRRLAEELLALPDDAPLTAPARVAAGSGTVVIEAPRGLLVHHYALDDLGRVAAADVVTPTAINQAAMEAQLHADLQVVPEPEMAGAAERIVRAFDPCISCSVHLLRG